MKFRFGSGVTLVTFGILSVILFGYSNCGKNNEGTGKTDVVIMGNPYSTSTANFVLKVVLNSTYPTFPTPHQVLTVGIGKQFADCQPAIDAANPGDEVVIDPAPFSCGPVTLTDKGQSAFYVVIRTAALANLPPQGTRLSENDFSNLAVIQGSATGGAAIHTSSSGIPNHYYFEGIEARTTASSADNIIALGTGAETSVAGLAHDFIFSQSYIHGNASQSIRHGVTLNATRVSIVDSVINQIQMVGDYSQAIAGWNCGVGPYQIVNNEITTIADGFNVGSVTTIANLIPSDLEIRKNLFSKPPLPANSDFVQGALLSLNNAQRVLIDGNTFENIGIQSMPGFASLGYAVGFVPQAHGTGSPGSGNSWVRVQEIQFFNNIIHDVAGALVINFQDPTDTLATTNSLDIENNLVYNVASSTVQSAGNPGVISLNGATAGPVTFNHNTLLDVPGALQRLITSSANGSFQNFTLSNNLTFNSAGGIQGDGVAAGATTLDAQYNLPSFSIPLIFRQNVLAGQRASNYVGYANGPRGTAFFPANLSAIGFVADPTSGVADYHSLGLTSSSPFHNQATDGQDIGAIIENIDEALAMPDNLSLNQ